MSFPGILVHVKLMLETDKTAAMTIAMVQLIVASSSCSSSVVPPACLFVKEADSLRNPMIFYV